MTVFLTIKKMGRTSQNELFILLKILNICIEIVEKSMKLIYLKLI
jgi:hypothetical protein